MLATRNAMQLSDKLCQYGVGRRGLGDELFGADEAPARLGVCQDSEDSGHDVVPPSERYRCGACRRALPSPHQLHLHVQETHDSFFAVAAARTPSYSCYVQECTEKFLNAEERLDHCVRVHKMPKDYRFDTKPKNNNKPKKKNKQNSTASNMEIDDSISSEKPKKFFFHNKKQKAVANYTGKQFTSDKTVSSSEANMDEIMSDLKESLPE